MKLIFTLTAGRTGTKYLAELLKANLPDAEAHHEILNYQAFGIEAPDISHFHEFNCRGNGEIIREFWRRKLHRILNCGKAFYAETSHMLMKAGLVENAAEFVNAPHEVHFVILKRDYYKTVISYRNRHDFENIGSRWLWYLDPDYPRNILSPEEYKKHGLHGIHVWYLNEIFTRAYYYKAKYETIPHFRFHEFDLSELNDQDGIRKLLAAIDGSLGDQEIQVPEPQNTTKSSIDIPEDEERFVRQLIEMARLDPVPVAAQLLERERQAIPTL